MGIEVRPATREDIPFVAKVLSEAVVHKAEQGDLLWGTEPYSIEEVEAKLEAGGLYTVTNDEEIVGTVTVTNSDERVWKDDGEDSALYIHQLAASDKVRGKNIGGQVIDWAANKAKTEGRKAVRLDCSYTNRRLCEYYESRGFVEVKRREIPRNSVTQNSQGTVYRAALLQRDLE